MIYYENEFTNYLTDIKKCSKNTFMAYIRDINQFTDFCHINGIKSAEKVDEPFIKNYLSYLKKIGKSDATKTRVIASIKCYFRFLYLNKYIKSDPASNLKNPRNEKKLPEVISPNDIMMLLKEPSGHDYKSIRDRAILELLYATGMRVSELIELKISDINTQIGIVNLHNGNKSRIVPIYKEASKHINEYIKYVRPAIIGDENTPELFVNLTGAPLSRQGCWKIIKYYADKAGIEGDITPKTLRHSFATHLLQNGANLNDVKEMLGHSDISSTQIYADIIKSKYISSYQRFHPLAK
ncbi:MAG: tyrosine recombinase [Clostridia bacterium]|nr:tyrosine recombinase [Clostridia bacterium]